MAAPRSRFAPLLAMVREEPVQFWRSVRSFIFANSRLEGAQITAEEWALPDERLRTKLAAHLTARGGAARDKAWKRAAISLLVSRSSQAISHADATREVIQLASVLDPRADLTQTFFAFARATRGVGLFEASMSFTELGYDSVEAAYHRGNNLRDLLRGVLVSLYRAQPELAVARWTALAGSPVPSGITSELFSMLELYMSALRRVTTGGTASQWKSDIRGKSILIAGPAPSGEAVDPRPQADLTARILRAFPIDKAAHSDLAREILYANGPWDRILREYPLESLRDDLLEYRHFVLKGGITSCDLPNARGTNPKYSRLFLSGHPNMIPLMCLDILSEHPAELYVEGVNFYASREPYRDTPAAALDAFRWCTAIGSHNPLENRRFVANFVDVGLVAGDSQFQEVLALSDLEYLRLLDEYYGEPQR